MTAIEASSSSARVSKLDPYFRRSNDDRRGVVHTEKAQLRAMHRQLSAAGTQGSHGEGTALRPRA